MLLDPVKNGAKVDLGDEAAARPDSLPKGGELKDKIDKQLEKLGELQSLFYADGKHSLLIVLQGRDASGKDGVVRSVIGSCNPAGVRVTSFKAPSPVELAHDYLWRIHNVAPEKGMIGIFNRSHYEDVLVVRVHKLVPDEVSSKRYAQINNFERMLSENGTIILKFFLHVSLDEQKVRLSERIQDETKNWKFRVGDLDDRQHWVEFSKAYHGILEHTSTKHAPWYIVPADDKDVRDWLVARTIADALDDLDLRYPTVDPAVKGITIE